MTKYFTREQLNILHNVFAKFKEQAKAECLAEMEKRVTYRGVWDEAAAYLRGNTVTHGSSLWHCNIDGTKQKPGNGSPDWKMSVKGVR